MKEIEALGIELLQQISVSNFSVVFKGRQSLLQRDVCVKVCVDGMQENSRERFLREAKVLTELKHPNIAGLLMYGLAEERPFMVLEWLDGTTLQERIKSGPLNPEEAISIFGQLTDALEYTHKLGIVHRDLKPANVFLDHRGQVKLLDFGIARAEVNFCDESTLTQTGLLLGSPAYMSPEQCRGEIAGPASDQYSLACVIYESLTGSLVFDGASEMELMFKHVNEEPSLGKVGAAARRVFLRALDKAPDNRYSSLRDSWDQINRVLPNCYADASSGVRRAATIAGTIALLVTGAYCFSVLNPDSAVTSSKSFTRSELENAMENLDELIYKDHNFKLARKEIRRYLNEIPAPKKRLGLKSSLPDDFTNYRAAFACKFTASLVAEVKEGHTLSPHDLEEGEEMAANYQRWLLRKTAVDHAAALKETADWNLYCKQDVKGSERQYRQALKLLGEANNDEGKDKLKNSISEGLAYIKAVSH